MGGKNTAGSASLRELLRRRSEGLAEHPSPEVLVAYDDGTLDPRAHDLVQEHVAWCEECARVLADFARFGGLEAPAAEHELSSAQLAGELRRFRQRVTASEEAMPDEPARSEPPPASSSTTLERRVRQYRALAAALLLAAVLSLLWGSGVLGPDRSGETVSQAPVVALKNRDQLRTRGPELRQELRVPAGVSHIPVRLPMAGSRGPVTGRLLDGDGTVLASSDALPQQNGAAWWWLPAPLLPAGGERVIVLTEATGRETEFPFQVSLATGP